MPHSMLNLRRNKQRKTVGERRRHPTVTIPTSMATTTMSAEHGTRVVRRDGRREREKKRICRLITIMNYLHSRHTHYLSARLRETSLPLGQIKCISQFCNLLRLKWAIRDPPVGLMHRVHCVVGHVWHIRHCSHLF